MTSLVAGGFATLDAVNVLHSLASRIGLRRVEVIPSAASALGPCCALVQVTARAGEPGHSSAMLLMTLLIRNIDRRDVASRPGFPDKDARYRCTLTKFRTVFLSCIAAYLRTRLQEA